MMAELSAGGWRSPLVLGLLVGLGGFVMLGPLGAAVGLIGGAAASRRAQAVLMAAALALFAAAALTIFEEPLDERHLGPGFVTERSLAEIAGAIAGVLLLAGLAGLLADRDRTRAPSLPAEKADVGGQRVPTSTIIAVLAAGLLAALLVWLLPS
jgi:hypothetical protein